MYVEELQQQWKSSKAMGQLSPGFALETALAID
jgi:hypothetical protein